jgi:predicted DNA-binding ribbon-helix-helix protein
MARKFKIGQYVFSHPANRPRRDGQYVVIAVFPEPDGDVRYLIRSVETVSSVEYIAKTTELRRAPSAKSLTARRKLQVNGRATSVCLEDAFNDALWEIAASQGVSFAELVSEIDRQQHVNLSSAVRLFILDYYRAQCDLEARSLH